VTTLREGTIEYHFPASWTVSQYDGWPFYRRHFEMAFGGCKATDIVALDPKETLWLVETKDYRTYPRTKPMDICDEVSLKVRDALAGIFAAAKWYNDHPHLADAVMHLAAKRIRVVLHVEQPARPSKLFARAFDLAHLQQQIKQRVRAVDPHPVVVDFASFGRLQWSANPVSGAT